MNNENIDTICVAVVIFGLAIIGFVLAFKAKFDNNIPSEEQKPQVQKVKTEVLTHVIRCTAYVNDTCAEYKVYNVIRE